MRVIFSVNIRQVKELRFPLHSATIDPSPSQCRGVTIGVTIPSTIYSGHRVRPSTLALAAPSAALALVLDGALAA